MSTKINGLISPIIEPLKKEKTILSTILLPVLLCLIIVWYSKFLWSRRKLYYHARNVPGPFAFPIIGAAYCFFPNPYKAFDILKNLCDKYGGLYKIWFGTRLYFVVTEPKYLQIVTTNQHSLEKSREYNFIQPIAGVGLISEPVSSWKRARKMILPALNQRALDQFVEVFVEYSDILIEQMKKYCGKKGEDINLFHIISRCTLDIICETAMGVKVNAQTSECKFSMWVDRGAEIVMSRIFNIFYHSDAIFGRVPKGKEVDQISKDVYKFILNVVAEKQTTYKNRLKRIQEYPEDDFHEDDHRKAFLDHLLELSEKEDTPFTVDELIGEVNTFIIGGFDTSATTMCFILTVLGLYPDVQQKVYEEVLDVLGPERSVEPKDLPNFKYMERVIKETLRFFPPGPFVARKATDDIDLGDYVIPKGSSIGLLLFYTLMNEKYWPDPYKFDPDRFLPEEVAKRQPCAYVPFSHGPRNCIGMKYAMMSLKSLTATVVRKYKMFTDYKNIKDIKLQPNVILRIEGSHRVSFEAREL